MSNANDWYVAEGGQTVGPMGKAELLEGIRSGKYNRETLVFTQGMSDWAPAAQVVGLTEDASPTTPPVTMHDVDYEIFGEEMQFVEVELDPGESAVAEAGGITKPHCPSSEGAGPHDIPGPTNFGSGSVGTALRRASRHGSPSTRDRAIPLVSLRSFPSENVIVLTFHTSF